MDAHNDSASEHVPGELEALSTEDKYRRLLVAYARTKTQNKVLKDAIIDEQRAYQALQGENVVLQQRNHAQLQELDVLGFNNRRLTKRLERLLEAGEKDVQAQAGARAKGSSLVSWMLGGAGAAASAERERVEDELRVATEHLQQKIRENEALHTARVDMQRAHADEVATLGNHVRALEAAAGELREQLLARITELNALHQRTAELEADAARWRRRADEAERAAAAMRLSGSMSTSIGDGGGVGSDAPGNGGGGGGGGSGGVCVPSCGHVRAACLRDASLIARAIASDLAAMRTLISASQADDTSPTSAPTSAPAAAIQAKLVSLLGALARDAALLARAAPRALSLYRWAAVRALGRAVEAPLATRAADRQFAAAVAALRGLLRSLLAYGLAAVQAAGPSPAGNDGVGEAGSGGFGGGVSFATLAALLHRFADALANWHGAGAARVLGDALHALGERVAALGEVALAFCATFEGAHFADVDPMHSHAGYSAAAHAMLQSLRAALPAEPAPASEGDVVLLQALSGEPGRAQAGVDGSGSGGGGASSEVGVASSAAHAAVSGERLALGGAAAAPSREDSSDTLSLPHSDETVRLRHALAARTAELAALSAALSGTVASQASAAESRCVVKLCASGADVSKYRPYVLLVSNLAGAGPGAGAGAGAGGGCAGDVRVAERESARLRAKLSAADARAGELYQAALAARQRVKRLEAAASETAAALAAKDALVAKEQAELAAVRGGYEAQLDTFTNHICSLNATLASQGRALDQYRRAYGELR